MKYLFTAQYNDGSVYNQTDADVSLNEPMKSAFYDIKDGDIATFRLEGEGHTYLVDLADGHFEIDGVPFFVEEVPRGVPLQLIYYRRHRHHFNAASMEELAHEIAFVFGWQYTDVADGKNHQQTIFIN